jgi:hypothetical protein
MKEVDSCIYSLEKALVGGYTAIAQDRASSAEAGPILELFPWNGSILTGLVTFASPAFITLHL